MSAVSAVSEGHQEAWNDERDKDEDEDEDEDGSSEQEAAAREAASLVQSRLFSGGLPPMDQWDAIDATINLYTPTSASRDAWWYELTLPKPSPDQAVGSSGETPRSLGLGSEQQEFVGEVFSGASRALAVDAWVLKHTGVSFSLRLGGECMQVARRSVLAALLKHTGVGVLVLHQWEAAEAAKGTSRAVDDDDAVVRPDDAVIRVWKGAQRVVEMMIQRKQTEGVAYTFLADLLERKVPFDN